IQRAEENARTQVEALFRTLGYKAVRVEIQPNSYKKSPSLWWEKDSRTICNPILQTHFFLHWL
ncbi:MAG: DUF4230 domain-containing protein, partial [Bacteroidaceae bacterium]|nr:DUF4230 domain-containing protein [Bacteroidaceae bacterium]